MSIGRNDSGVWRASGVALFSLILSMIASAPARADRYYVGLPGGGTGNWNNAANWSDSLGGPGGAGVPAAGDVAFLRYGDLLDRSVVLDVNATTAGLWIGSTSPYTGVGTSTGTVTLVQNAFDLTTQFESLGIYFSGGTVSFGAHLQTGGTNTTASLLIGNDYSPLTGRYTISGGTLNANTINVGVWGEGQFIQTGGFVSGNVDIGNYESYGDYTLSAGTLHAASLGLANGYIGDCTFTQSGGTAVIGGITVGNGDLQTGTIFLNGASAGMTVTGGERYGFHGNGAFEQSAGSHVVGAGGIFMGGSSGWGRYDLSGGTLTVLGPVHMSNNGGTFNQTGGVATIGTISTNQDLTISQGRGTISGAASLAVYGNETLDGGYATFSQQSGRHTISGALSVDGHFLLAGGSLQVGGNELVGQRLDQAAFVQTAGSHSVGGMLGIGGVATAHGEFDLTDGSLIVSGAEIVGAAGTGTMVQSGGVQIIHGPLTVGASSTALGWFALGGAGIYVTQLSVLGGETVGSAGLGWFDQSSGLHNVGTTSANADLTIGSAGGFGVFVLDNHSADVPLNLTVYGDEFVGYGGSTGTFRQFSGSHNVRGALTLGDDSAGTGTYLMGGGALDAATLDIRSTGTFIHLSERFFTENLRVGALRVAGHLTLMPGSHMTPVVGSLMIDNATGKFDLGDNNLIVDYTGSPGTLVGNVLQSLLTGALFTSAGSAANRIGYGDNAILHQTRFGNLPVDSTSLLIGYTFGGDANLDGKVDVSDLGALATNWQTPNVWTGGDFNYDGFVDVTDLGALATNWQAGVGNPLSPGSLNSALASLGLGYAAVPEPLFPTTTVVAAFLFVATHARRRRWHSSFSV